MEAKLEIRNLFLEEFVRRAIINSLNKYQTISKGKDLFEKLDNVSKAPLVLEIKKPIIIVKKEVQPAEIMPKQIQPVSPIIQRPIAKPMTMEMKKEPQIQAAPRPPVHIMDRLNIILADPSVQSINCPGPDKKILVMRRGIAQQINLSFTSEDIKIFLKEISEKTKIPLGIFYQTKREILEEEIRK